MFFSRLRKKTREPINTGLPVKNWHESGCLLCLYVLQCFQIILTSCNMPSLLNV